MCLHQAVIINVSIVYRSQAKSTHLTRDTSRDNNELGVLEGFREAIVVGEVAFDLRRRVDVRQVRRDTGRVDDIVQRELITESSFSSIRRSRHRNFRKLGEIAPQ